MEFFFEDHLRLDWGFGNPNKTAALIACLLVASHFLRLIKPRVLGTVLFGVSFIGLGICLIHTYSRGGIVAAVLGQISYWIYLQRGRLNLPPRPEFLVGIAMVGFLAIYAALPQVNAASRYAQGVVPGGTEDLSISNRLRIWKDAPRMMVDAPGGWGIGEAGEGWTQWYQPLETRYLYRTLVNSHLTYMAELNWGGRFGYCFVWLLLLFIPFFRFGDSVRVSQISAVTGGVWIAFGIAAVFSTIAESAILWVLPVVTLILSTIFVWIPLRSGSRCRWGRAALFASVSALLVCLVAFGWGGAERKSSKFEISVRGGAIQVGSGKAKMLLVEPDKSIVGKHYGHTIRENAEQSWLVIPEWKSELLPEEADTVVLSGIITPELLKAERIIVLNPLNMYADWNGQDSQFKILVGSMRRDPVSRAMKSMASGDDLFASKFTLVPGKKLFLGDWVSILKQEPAISNP